MIFFPRMLAGILLNGSEQIRLACLFMPRCGIMLIFVDSLFVVRNCVQGMGKPMLPMASGILEMVLRITVISFLMGRLGFKATAYAEISAWIGALLINAFAFYAAIVPSDHYKELIHSVRSVLFSSRKVPVKHGSRG